MTTHEFGYIVPTSPKIRYEFGRHLYTPSHPCAESKPPKCAAGAHVSCGLCRPSLSAFKHCRKHAHHPPLPHGPHRSIILIDELVSVVRGCVRVCEYVRASTTGLISSTCVRSCVDYRAIIDAIDHHHHHTAAPPLNRSQIAHTYFQYLSPSTGFGGVGEQSPLAPAFVPALFSNWCSHRRRVLHTQLQVPRTCPLILRMAPTCGHMTPE